MCGWIVLKFYKKTNEVGNHEICHDVMISYVETMVTNWESFIKVGMYFAYKLKNL